MKVLVENKIVTEAIDPSPIAFKYISFASSKDNTIDVFYNCPEHSGSKLEYDFIESMNISTSAHHYPLSFVVALALAVLLASFRVRT